jgi:hypothetical protein
VYAQIAYSPSLLLPADKRKAEAARIKEKYPDRIPVRGRAGTRRQLFLPPA